MTKIVDLSTKYLNLIGKRKLYPPLNGYSAFLQGSEYNTNKYLEKWYDGKARIDLFVYMKKGFSQIWLSEDDIKFEAEFGFREYLKDKNKFNLRQICLVEGINNINDLYNRYTYEKIENCEWQELFTLINEVRDIIWNANAAAGFSIILEQEMIKHVLQEHNLLNQITNFDEFWEKASEPAFESFDKSQLFDILTLVKENFEKSSLAERCQYFFADYHSVKSLTEAEMLINQVYGSFLSNPDFASEKYQSEQERLKKVIFEHQKWLGGLSDFEKELAEYLQIVMKTRDRRKNFFAKGMTLMYRVAEKMFRQFGLDRELIPYYTAHELLQGPDYLKMNIESVKNRVNGFQWLVPYSGPVEASEINIDEGSDRVNKYFKDSHLKNGITDELKGQSAYRGIVRGTARIVLNVKEKYILNPGDILVAGMTRPEYVSLMYTAGAIVTDEGGITCHAAIVSRELKKPCIIGTKIATKVLRDGDLVEVDANLGIIKIIS